MRQTLEIEYAETETEISELQKNYVINKRSYLVNLRDFDITTQLPQDIMHTFWRGQCNINYEFFY